MFGPIYFSLLFNSLCSCPLTTATVVQWSKKNEKCFVEVKKKSKKAKIKSLQKRNGGTVGEKKNPPTKNQACFLQCDPFCQQV